MLTTLRSELRDGWKQMLAWGIGFALLTQGMMLAALCIRFLAVPNYVVFYDWPGNVATIIDSTPSVSDMLPIIAGEWLIEIGQMNYSWGNGISVWALNVVPAKLLLLFAVGALVCLCRRLLRQDSCPGTLRNGAGVATGLGVGLVALTNATMSWVVCCATPNWVVGLAMMGLGVSTSLALEPYGTVLAISGFGLLALAVLALAWRKSRNTDFHGEPTHA
ncbi:hypothetical protein AB0T83_09020 [Fluviibacterium sp. DFM31]|uniref:DUF4328 domain-containing protein n=1 Tax=Meridianimarinicoccus marinus TaxID=3231483 RepID=A0ABV3L5R3_9RHOB